jgi:hypothetical protein
MEANEVRKGNLVDFRGQTETVYQIRNSGVCFFRGTTKTGVITQSYVWEAIKPIPLTEEWLLKFGFLKRKKSLALDVFENKVLYIRFDNQDKYQFFLNGKYIQIHYLHQLQNLYFALTGTELTLNK